MASPDRNIVERLFEEQSLLVVGLSYLLAVLLVLLTEIIGMQGDVMLAFAILVPVIPFLIIMAATGRLKKLTVGSFEILFTEAIASDIQLLLLEDEIMEIPPANIEAIAPYDGDEIEVEYRTVLRFRLGEWHDREVVDRIVADMPRLSFIIFNDPLGGLSG